MVGVAQERRKFDKPKRKENINGIMWDMGATRGWEMGEIIIYPPVHPHI